MSVLDPAGPQAGSIAALWQLFQWVAVVVFLIVGTAFVVAIARSTARRRGEGDANPLVLDLARERRMTRLIAASGGVSVVILFALLVASIRSGSQLASLEDRPDALHVRITGHQWWWQIDYEHDAPTLSATTANELHIPVGRPVHLELTSSDVIHSFWVPSVHGKKDLIPGRINRTWIEVDEPGEFEGQCAEFCGLEHARMRLKIIAEPPAVFAAWLAHQRTSAESPATAEAQRGQDIFLGGPCVTCHAVSGTKAGGQLGPDLTHLASRMTIAAGELTNNRGNLAGWLLDPQSQKPGVHMPAITLASTDLDALLAYLETLQ
jgi:cytochrome c oxidase subunit II